MYACPEITISFRISLYGSHKTCQRASAGEHTSSRRCSAFADIHHIDRTLCLSGQYFSEKECDRDINCERAFASASKLGCDFHGSPVVFPSIKLNSFAAGNIAFLEASWRRSVVESVCYGALSTTTASFGPQAYPYQIKSILKGLPLLPADCRTGLRSSVCPSGETNTTGKFISCSTTAQSSHISRAWS